ncbi:MAG TPA: DNA-3-methyladenine glycosylase, partial [Candidatus Goldiibacteriota bacterium]|nr:DNA-3-methyladenine glycosylase [Candidatus Goldiibacteriota bacterium]
ASRGMTKRNAPMFGPAGRSYVYFCYGNHYLFNIVTGRQGEPGAVLIRALEPFEGISAMKKRRANSNLFCLCSGPAKLTQALAIKKRDNDRDLTSGGLYLAGNGRKKFAVCRGPRIGIRHGLEKKWRFWIKGNRHVSA